MQRYLLGRLLQTVVSLWVVVTIVFFLTRLTGSPVDLVAPFTATEADRQEISRSLGLDRPVLVQYGIYMAGLLKGDFGNSLTSGRPVLENVFLKLPNTLELGGVAILVSLALGVPLGVFSSLHRGGWIDKVARVFAIIGQALPPFWLGIVLLLLFSVTWHVFPPGGKEGPSSFVLPAFTMGYFASAAIMRLTRSCMLDVLTTEYVKFARSKGLSETVVVWKHALRNAVLPVITYSVMLFVLFLGAAVVTESVFSWPGLGRLILDSVNARDYPTVQAGVLIFSAIYMLANLLVDILYAYLNPRIRYGAIK